MRGQNDEFGLPIFAGGAIAHVLSPNVAYAGSWITNIMLIIKLVLITAEDRLYIWNIML